eukprot:945212-Prymnesium_polylepis.1
MPRALGPAPICGRRRAHFGARAARRFPLCGVSNVGTWRPTRIKRPGLGKQGSIGFSAPQGWPRADTWPIWVTSGISGR